MKKKIISTLLIAATLAVPVLASSMKAEAAEAAQKQTVQVKKVSEQAERLVSVARSIIKGQGIKYAEVYKGDIGAKKLNAAFIGYCASKAGIPASIIPRFSSCLAGVIWFRDNGQWKNEKYIPQKGDLIFLTDDHVAIVEEVKNGRVCAIESDNKAVVTRKVYTLKDEKIGGYGVPKYTK